MSTISITTRIAAPAQFYNSCGLCKPPIKAASTKPQYQQQHEQRKKRYRQEVDGEDEEECNESPTDLPILGEVHVHMAVCHLTKSLHSRIKMWYFHFFSATITVQSPETIVLLDYQCQTVTKMSMGWKFPLAKISIMMVKSSITTTMTWKIIVENMEMKVRVT